jgi:hypothetical protein
MLHAVGNNKERAGIGEGDSLQQTHRYWGGGLYYKWILSPQTVLSTF